MEFISFLMFLKRLGIISKRISKKVRLKTCKLSIRILSRKMELLNIVKEMVSLRFTFMIGKELRKKSWVNWSNRITMKC
jgi:hypothetical protein